MASRKYRLGPRRRADVDRTRSSILAAARELVSEHGPDSSVGKVAELAGVSRITIYNQFGSKAGLLETLFTEAGPQPAGTPVVEPGADPADDLRRRIEQACAAWAANPRLYRQLAGSAPGAGLAPGAAGLISGDRPDHDHALAERLAAADRLRPGCSIKEAEDVIGILTSFPVFDRLHKEGRRSASAVAEILLRMASGTVTAGSRV
ncbi:MAG TPA: helix-turn-helix domain-containing protein [Candidatus Dormibacteraeota bacterium]|nr:helix-turn-helix domain-containing protein [Candidatus Dormibacteraeota bacterium]